MQISSLSPHFGVKKQNNSKTPYTVTKERIDGKVRKRKPPPKLCFDCKDTNDCIKLLSEKTGRIEQVVDKLGKIVGGTASQKSTISNIEESSGSVSSKSLTSTAISPAQESSTSTGTPRKVEKKNFSLFNAKFTLNNVPCELEYDLSKFNLESLQKFVIVTTQTLTNQFKKK